MANSFALITKYLTNAIDTVFAQESKSAVLENGKKYMDLNFSQAGYVKILSILMDGLSDYHSQNSGAIKTGYQVGSVSSEWEILKLTQKRGRQFQIDYLDDEEQAGQILANLLTEFLRTQVLPEVDAYRFSALAGKTNKTLGNRVEGTIEANKIISLFNAGYTWLSLVQVPKEDQVIFVSTEVMSMIRNTTELQRRLVTKTNPDSVTLLIEEYEGRPIIEVPDTRFITDIAISPTNSFGASATSKVINFIIASKRAVVPVVKVERPQIFGVDQVQDFYGYKVNFMLYHDIIVPKNKLLGIYAHIGTKAGSTVTGALKVALTLVSTGKYKLEGAFSFPTGLNGRIINSATALTLGAAQTVTSENEFKVGTEKEIAGTKQHFALVDGFGKVVAISGEITLPTA